jgi:hypothetical protein
VQNEMQFRLAAEKEDQEGEKEKNPKFTTYLWFAKAG